jgi:D-proline reductase (dithiol) PrdB
VNLTRIKNQLLARLYTAVPALAAHWGERLVPDNGVIPWAEPLVPLPQSTLALVTTGGVHLTTQHPFDMSDSNGDPTLREIPVATSREQLTITHDYYNHQDADQDLNLVFPVERLEELVRAGVLGALHPIAYGIMGHIDGEHIPTLRNRTAVEIAASLAAARVDYALLVPA